MTPKEELAKWRSSKTRQRLFLQQVLQERPQQERMEFPQT
jgi:hypothetical protein